MVIEKINIKSFGALLDVTMDFSGRINIIEGPNESGKSTVAAFIRYMMYGFDNSDQAALPERKKRINWTTGLAQGSMIVRVKGKRYLINRSTALSETSPDRYREDCSIVDLETGAPCFGKTPAGEVFFGVDREVFENTAFIGQFSDTRIGEGEMKEAIENILFSGSEKINTQRASQKIRAKMESLLHEGETGGAIVDLNRRLSELGERLDRARADNSEVLAMTAKEYELRRDRDESSEREKKLFELDSCYKNVMLIQTFDKLHELEKQSDEATEKYNSYIEEHRVGGFVPDDAYLTDIAVTRRVVNDTFRRLGEAKEREARLSDSATLTAQAEERMRLSSSLGGDERLEALAASVRMKGRVYPSCALASLFFALALLLVGMLAPLSASLCIAAYVLSGLLAAGAAALAVLFVINRRKCADMRRRFGVQSDDELLEQISHLREAREAFERASEEHRRAKAELEAAAADYDRAKEELCNVIVKWGRTPPADNINEFLDTLEGDVKEFLAGLDRLATERNNIEATVNEIRRSLADKNEVDIRAQVSPLKRRALSGVNYDEIVNGIAACRSQTAQLEREADGIEQSLSGIKARAEDPADIACRIAVVKARVDELNSRHTAYEVALRSIEGAGERLRSEISPRLAEYSKRLLKIMTKDKYSDVDVNSALHMVFSDGEDNRSAEYLSGGTQNIAYIALRLALVDLLYRETPPVCLDESFSHQDNLRARSLMSALVYLSDQGQQNFVFTCRARESAIAKELDKRTAVFRLPIGTDTADQL